MSSRTSPHRYAYGEIAGESIKEDDFHLQIIETVHNLVALGVVSIFFMVILFRNVPQISPRGIYIYPSKFLLKL